MSMTQIVSFLDLSIYPSIAMVFFLAAFIGITWRVMTRPQQEIIDASRIVLDDDHVVTPRVASMRRAVTEQPTPALPDTEKGIRHE